MEQVKPASRPRPGAESDDRAALREEIARQKEEILRLRDLLIAKDAELGAARGSLAELTEHSARYLLAARRIQGFLPSLLRRITAVLRGRG